MRGTIALTVALTAAIVGVCPAVAAHPAYLGSTLPYAAAHPSVAFKAISSGKLWCDSCGRAVKVKRLKFKLTRSHGELLLCRWCIHHVKL